MSEATTVRLDLLSGYRFTVDVGDPATATLVVDEPPPVGDGSGPDPSQLLAAAVGHCLSASALFCLRKTHVEVTAMRTTVTVATTRNAAGRLRIGGLRVELQPTVDAADLPRLGRCLELFEDFCVVTQSVRRGVDVQVQVAPAVTDQAAAEDAARGG